MTEAEGALHEVRSGSAREDPGERSIEVVDLHEALLRAQSDLDHAEETLSRVRTKLESAMQTVESLRRLNQDKDEFLNVVAHDLKTPLAVVSGFAETLLENWEAIGEEQRLQVLGRIAENARKLADQVEQDLARTRRYGEEKT